jgi:hypothetical protein
MHTSNKPFVLSGPVMVLFAYPAPVWVRLHERQKERASVLVKFVIFSWHKV